MLTPRDLRYLLRLVQCDAMDGVSMARSLRVEKKLANMLSERKVVMWTMAPKKKAVAKPKGPISKAVKRK